MREYKTTDFYLAIHLHSKGVKLSTTNLLNPRQLEFVFEIEDDHEVEDFLFARASGSINKYISSLREFKRIIREKVI